MKIQVVKVKMLTTEFVLCSKLDLITCTLMIRGQDVGSSPFLQWLKAQFCVHGSQEVFINPTYVTCPPWEIKMKGHSEWDTVWEIPQKDRKRWREKEEWLTLYLFFIFKLSNYLHLDRLWAKILIGHVFSFIKTIQPHWGKYDVCFPRNDAYQSQETFWLLSSL